MNAAIAITIIVTISAMAIAIQNATMGACFSAGGETTDV
jgi:hypothetical protein